jgi:hypothetical protein
MSSDRRADVDVSVSFFSSFLGVRATATKNNALARFLARVFGFQNRYDAIQRPQNVTFIHGRDYHCLCFDLAC